MLGQRTSIRRYGQLPSGGRVCTPPGIPFRSQMDLAPESKLCKQGGAPLEGRAQALQALSNPPVHAVKSRLRLWVISAVGRVGSFCPVVCFTLRTYPSGASKYWQKT